MGSNAFSSNPITYAICVRYKKITPFGKGFRMLIFRTSRVDFLNHQTSTVKVEFIINKKKSYYKCRYLTRSSLLIFHDFT